MTLFPTSATDLTKRRRKLRRRRRFKSLQAIWRSIALIGLTVGLVSAIALPMWTIRQPEQITIEGNRFLSAAAIRSLVPVSYPQSLFRLQPQEIAAKLESQGSIASATVTRQLVPPRLTIQVTERQPVAIVQFSPAPNSPNPAPGLLDEQGVWISLASYTALDRSLPLPKLKVVGMSEQYLPYWSALYQTVSRSPVKISEINCQDPTNLILKTELGNVHLGAYSSRLAAQLRVLDRMRELPTRLKNPKISYIDLKNPDFPTIQPVK